MMERARCGQAASLSELSRVISSQVCWPGWRGLGTCHCKKPGILPSRTLGRYSRCQCKWVTVAGADMTSRRLAGRHTAADRDPAALTAAVWPELPPGCDRSRRARDGHHSFSSLSFRWLRESRSMAVVSQAKTRNLKLRLGRLKLERECHRGGNRAAAARPPRGPAARRGSSCES